MIRHYPHELSGWEGLDTLWAVIDLLSLASENAASLLVGCELGR
jgi:hypothetical protein